ncbi:MAG: heavy-metal-associated domain-containing protein [Chloroflexi bacterium]|nr:heavy-metal-associated domain-containing protein [Chloroflexota bacterium]MCC6897142.1 heavy-metal-associated domain-containing protein [Anaerolineae bacterium]
MESKTFQVPNIGCDGCVKTIKNEVSQITGVKKVDGVVDSKTVTVEWDTPATWQQIESTLKEIEYPPATLISL